MEIKNEKTIDWDNILYPAAVLFVIFLGVALKGGHLQKMDYFQEKNALKKIEVKAKLNNNKIDFLISNKSKFSFKDLEVDCNFVATSGKSLKNEGFTIYKAFSKQNPRGINGFVVNKIPSQTAVIECNAVDLEIIDHKIAKNIIHKEMDLILNR